MCRKDGLWQDIIYNKLLIGSTIEGKVLRVKEELVKLHLNIDENQNEDEAFWFPFLPPTVNIMYSMPLVGESVRLYFPNESSEQPISREPKSMIWCESLTQRTNVSRVSFLFLLEKMEILAKRHQNHQKDIMKQNTAVK